MSELFDTSVPNISMHISNIIRDNELNANSVVKDYLTTAADGKQYNVTFYGLDMIIAVAFRVRSKRGVQFRRWANTVLKEYMQKGFVMDDERLKNPDGRPDYYDELLERIRDIRASEKRLFMAHVETHGVRLHAGCRTCAMNRGCAAPSRHGDAARHVSTHSHKHK